MQLAGRYSELRDSARVQERALFPALRTPFVDEWHYLFVVYAGVVLAGLNEQARQGLGRVVGAEDKRCLYNIDHQITLRADE